MESLSSSLPSIHSIMETDNELTGSVASGTTIVKTTTVVTDYIQRTLLNATDEEKESLFMALNSKYEVTDVLPPPNHDDQQVLVMAFGYMLLFMMGTCGNAVVLSKIYDVVKSRRSNFVDNTVIYIVVLCFVDFGVCLSLPMTVIDQILGFWMFGTIVCKIHAVLENFGKVFSALVLTAMAFDRYAGVCHPQRKYLRKTSVAILILIGMIVYAIVTLSPLLSNFTAREIVLFEKETAPHKITRMRIEKCTMVNVSSTNFTIFTGILFIFCFVVPLVLVGYFYSQLWWKLRQHARQFKASQIPLMRVSLLTLVMAFFYFTCWAPFWFATVYAVYLEYQGDQGGLVPPIFVYFMYFIHALPFTNSAVNWILYGMLNRQLQRKKANWSDANNNNNTTNCCHTEPNTTLIANGHTPSQITSHQTLKNVPSLNGISINKIKQISSSYDSQFMAFPSQSKRSSCYIQMSLNESIPTPLSHHNHYLHQNAYQYHIPSHPSHLHQNYHNNSYGIYASHHYGTNILNSRSSVPIIDLHRNFGNDDKRKLQSDAGTQTNLLSLTGYNETTEFIGICRTKKPSVNDSSKDDDFANTSFIDSSYSSTNSTNNNVSYFDQPLTKNVSVSASTKERRSSGSILELENLILVSQQQDLNYLTDRSMNNEPKDSLRTIWNHDRCCYYDRNNIKSSDLYSDNEDVDVLLKSDHEATFL